MKALIVGGGIAGPATALALDKAGIESTVLEARPRPEAEEGSYFTLSANGLAALATVDALHLARSTGFRTDRNVMLGATGRRLGAVTFGAPLPDGTRALTTKRTRLATLLGDEAQRRGVVVRHGAKAVDVSGGPHGVAVTLDDGTSLRADLLVGADGVHSIVRRAIDPAAPSARYVGLTNFGGITRATALADRIPPREWHFVFGRRAFTGVHRTPDGDVVWFVNVPRGPISGHERATTSPEQWLGYLVELVADDAGPAAELIGSGELELAADNTHDLAHVPSWHRDRMIVLGDAAHAPAPSSGQGASMSLEDAVVLARSLRDESTIERAFTAFESQRRARVERIVAMGARSSSAKTPGRAGRLLRDAGMRVAFGAFVTERSMAWVNGYRVDWEPGPADRAFMPHP